LAWHVLYQFVNASVNPGRGIHWQKTGYMGVNKMRNAENKMRNGIRGMHVIDGDNHVTIHIPHFITPAVSRVVNKMRKSRAK